MRIVSLLLLVLALAVVAFAARTALTGSAASSDPAAATQPRRQLEQVRQRAAELGDELRRKADRADVER